MLVLSRKIGESIIIGADIEIRLNKIEGDVVKLGIIAPKEVAINRKEILDAVKQSNKAAALSKTAAVQDLQKVRQLLPKIK